MTSARNEEPAADGPPPFRLVIVEALGSGNGLRLVSSACDLGFRTLFVTTGRSRYQDDLQRSLLASPPASLSVVEGVNTTSATDIARALEPVVSDHPVVLSQVDRSQHVASLAAEQLGLATPLPSGVIRRCTDKGELRSTLAAACISPVATQVVGNLEQAVSAAATLGWPVVAKPLRGTGSVGVRLVRDEDELRSAIEALRSMGSLEMLIEEYLVGPLVSLELFRWCGQTVALGLTDRVLSPPPEFAELAWTYPMHVAPGLESRITELGDHILSHLGFSNGAAHLEFVLTQDGPKVVEVNPRMAGRGLTDLVSMLSGYNEYEMTLRAALGEGPGTRGNPLGMFGGEHVISGPAGPAVAPTVLEEAARLPGVQHVRYLPASRALGTAGGLLDLGEVQALGSTFAEAQARARAAAQFVMGQI